MSSARAQVRPSPLPRVRAGSWVYGTLSTWMGDADKNRGWDLLVASEARLRRGRRRGAACRGGAHARASQQLAACEASDWFWWFGDYNPAGAVRDFDELFRHQLTSLYRALNLEPPADAVASDQRGPWQSRGRRRDAARMKTLQKCCRDGARACCCHSRRCGVRARVPWAHSAFRFIDWLADAGFSVWQVLPLVPVGTDGSPYWARSDRAGNPALIDPAVPDPGSEADFEACRARPATGSTTTCCSRRSARSSAARPGGSGRASCATVMPGAMDTAALSGAPQIDHISRQQWRFDAQWRAVRAARRGARHCAVRRPADLCGAGFGGDLGESRAVPARRGRPSGNGIGRAAGLLRGRRPAVGQSAVSLVAAPAGRFRLLDAPPAAAGRPL